MLNNNRYWIIGSDRGDTIDLNDPSALRPDNASGQDGNDTIFGNAQDNELLGGQGNDLILGGWGNDVISGGDDDDTLFGGHGNDTIGGDCGNDKLFGGAGRDNLDGGRGDDWLYGGDGNDELSSFSGHDKLDGGAGNDTLFVGNSASGRFAGGDGNDTFNVRYFDLGKSEFDGGAGDDVFTFNSVGDDTEVTLQAADFKIDGGSGTDTFRLTTDGNYDDWSGFSSIERLELTGDVSVTLSDKDVFNLTQLNGPLELDIAPGTKVTLTDDLWIDGSWRPLGSGANSTVDFAKLGPLEWPALKTSYFDSFGYFADGKDEPILTVNITAGADVEFIL